MASRMDTSSTQCPNYSVMRTLSHKISGAISKKVPLKKFGRAIASAKKVASNIKTGAMTGGVIGLGISAAQNAGGVTIAKPLFSLLAGASTVTGVGPVIGGVVLGASAGVYLALKN